MADYRDKLEELRDAAKRKARELDEKYGIKDRVEEGARAAQEAARRGAETVAGKAERAREEAERFSEDYELRDRARQAAEEAQRAAREAGNAFRAGGRAAGEKAGEVFDEARGYYERAAQFYETSARVSRATSAATVGLVNAYDWARKNPRQVALVSLSVVTGVRLGAAFPGLDATLLGAHPHWLTHSALPVYALRTVGQKFNDYLQERERLVAQGELSEAEQQRAEFERKIV